MSVFSPYLAGRGVLRKLLGLAVAIAALSIETTLPSAAETLVVAQRERPTGRGHYERVIVPLISRCTNRLTREGVFWGDPNILLWNPDNAAWLCDIATVGSDPIQCFSSNLATGLGWQQAIATCRQSAGRPIGVANDRTSWRKSNRNCRAPSCMENGGRPANTPVVGGVRPLPAPRPQPPAPPFPPSVVAGLVEVTLENSTGWQVDFYTINRSGEPVMAGSLQPGKSTTFNARSQTEFIFGAGGRQFATYKTGADPSQFFNVRYFETLPARAVNSPEVSPQGGSGHGASGRYHYVFSFTSMCCGIDGTTAAALRQYLDGRRGSISYRRAPWGLEGEVDYCVHIDGGAGVDRDQIHADMMAIVEGKRVRVKQNTECRQS